jgi:type II secretory pathway predicted ATPase ExeA
MYYQHFGLDQAPFRITPNTDFFFSGGNRGPILEALIYAIAQGEGIVKVTGEVGSGKTMLCNMLQARLPANVETVYLAHPNVQPEEILHAIAFELQLPVERSAARIEVMHRLHDHLLSRHAEGKRVVMFIEESQSMPLATLEEIRLLSNLETRNDKLLQIVLFGQPELDDNLAEPRIRQLKERITHSFRLGPLSAPEAREYLMFRLRTAGYRGPDLFSSKVVNRITRASRGLTRRINLIADKALLAAFSENTHTIRLAHVKDAVRDSEFGHEEGAPRGMRAAWGVGLLAMGAIGGALAYALVFEDARREVDAPRMANIAAATAAPAPVAVPAQGSSVLPAKPAAVQPAPAPSTAPAETVASEVSPPAPGLDAIVEQRFAASRAWLADAPPTAFSIQLMGVEDESHLKRHLNDLAKSIEINKVFLYRSVANRKALLTVLYGSFVDRRAAQEALDALPAELQANRPFLRTVRGIRAEILRQQSS